MVGQNVLLYWAPTMSYHASFASTVHSSHGNTMYLVTWYAFADGVVGHSQPDEQHRSRERVSYEGGC